MLHPCLLPMLHPLIFSLSFLVLHHFPCVMFPPHAPPMWARPYIYVKQVWYPKPAGPFNILIQELPRSHSQLVSNSVGITSSYSFLAFLHSVSLRSSHLCCLCFSLSRARNCARLLIHAVATPVLQPAIRSWLVKSHGNNVRDVIISHTDMENISNLRTSWPCVNRLTYTHTHTVLLWVFMCLWVCPPLHWVFMCLWVCPPSQPNSDVVIVIGQLEYKVVGKIFNFQL